MSETSEYSFELCGHDPTESSWHVHSDPEPLRRYQGQGSTAEKPELGLILEWMCLGVDLRLTFLPCRATGLVLGE